MAHMYPSRYLGDEWGEEQVFKSLSKLSNDWRVISDFHFSNTSDRRRSTLDAQADFVLLHRNFGGLVIEVKGGHVSVEKGEWFSQNREGKFEIKDPFKQASDYKYPIKRLIEERLGIDMWFSHAAAFPVVDRDEEIGGQSRELTLFKGDLADIQTALDRLFTFVKPRDSHLSLAEIEEVAAFMAPTEVLEPSVADRSGQAHQRQAELTERQRHGFAMTRQMRRLWVTGGAGTGKTLLAVGRATELGSQGKKVMLVCFNTLLGEDLQESVEVMPTVHAGTFHSIAKEFGNPKPTSMSMDEWLESGACDALLSNEENEGTWDAVIVDEGQDFQPEWLAALELMLCEDGSLIVFSDQNQQVIQRKRVAELPDEPFVLDVNCRNTPEIHRRVNEVFGLDGDCLAAQSMIEPRIFKTCEIDRTVRNLIVERLQSDGLQATDLVILSSSKAFVEGFRGQRVGRTNVIGERNGKDLLCETVHRFKGLEAEAVILVIPSANKRLSEIAYVGMSRARTILDVVVAPDLASEISWS